jgi:hypothetical protein
MHSLPPKEKAQKSAADSGASRRFCGAFFGFAVGTGYLSAAAFRRVKMQRSQYPSAA